MLDIHHLERRWLKYKIKSYLPYGAIFFLLLFAIIATALLWPKHTYVSKPSQLVSQNSNPDTETLHQTQVSLPNTNATILEPSMEFVRTFDESSHPITPSSSPETVKITKPDSKATAKQPPLPPIPKTLSFLDQQPSQAKVQPPATSNMTLTINRNESALDITELEQRFKETSNANLGLFIARYYYEHGNYSESYNYSLKTNAVNSRIDESWIIFSKSLVKLGKIDQAKKTLRFYISQSGSDTAKGLLDMIERGNFK